MRRIALISWLVILSATTGGGVWAAERIAAKACTAAAPVHLTTVEPLDALSLADGRIVAVDAKDGRLTVKHRGVSRFYLEPGTFIFHVGDRSLLTGLTPGDKIRFDVEREGKRYAITRIENSN